MKFKRVFIVRQVEADGSLGSHPSFDGREFVTPTDVLGEVTDTESRISKALSEKSVPDPADQEYLNALSGTEICVLETLTFEKSQGTNPTQARKLVEPRDPGKGEIAALQKQLADLTKKMLAMEKASKASK